MKWKKLGRIFSPDHEYDWMVSHASNPFALPIGDSLSRVYFSCRDEASRSSIAYVVIDMNAPQDILEISSNPVIGPGDAGLFDDSGTSLGCIVEGENGLHLYYLGWNLGVTVPWRCEIGAAISDDGGLTFTKVSRAPILGRSDADPLSLSYPWVMSDGGNWKMWYGSHRDWGANPHALEFEHVLKYATSADGIRWARDDITCLEPALPGIFAVAKPCVLKDDAGYHLWYVYRGDQYRIGYACSEDGMHWTQDGGGAGIEPSAGEWEAVAYPHVIKHGGARFMFYNGNGYGATGMGLAVSE